MWLEVDRHHAIVGLHSHRCESEHTWVEAKEIPMDAMPGDQWINGKFVRVATKKTKTQKQEAQRNERRQVAYKVITRHYPEWQQLNILRGGDAEKIKNMGHFIDAVRAWSNAPSVPEKKLQSIQDEFFPNNNKNTDKTTS